MKNMWYLIAALTVAAVVLLSGCVKNPDTTIEEDGGVRHYVDTNAPKVIKSTQIVTFFCDFSTLNLSMDSSPVAGRYYTLRAGQDGGSYEARAGGEVFGELKFTPDGAFFDALQKIVSEHDLAQYNGQFCTVSGLPPDYGAVLDIRYDSGETIHASDNQSCFLPMEAMEALVMLFQGQNP